LVFLTDGATEWSYAIEVVYAIEQAQRSAFLIDLQEIEGALFFRQVQAGDRLRVAGMNGTKKVLQILKEGGLPAPLRKQQFVLCDQQKIIAVPNLELNAMVQAKENSTHLAVLHFSKKL
jgi:tRNA(Ile)-lysidine synthetase-like protein